MQHVPFEARHNIPWQRMLLQLKHTETYGWVRARWRLPLHSLWKINSVCLWQCYFAHLYLYTNQIYFSYQQYMIAQVGQTIQQWMATAWDKILMKEMRFNKTQAVAHPLVLPAFKPHNAKEYVVNGILWGAVAGHLEGKNYSIGEDETTSILSFVSVLCKTEW
jgi:hypothetical protein